MPGQTHATEGECPDEDKLKWEPDITITKDLLGNPYTIVQRNQYHTFIHQEDHCILIDSDEAIKLARAINPARKAGPKVDVEKMVDELYDYFWPIQREPSVTCGEMARRKTELRAIIERHVGGGDGD